MPFLECFLVDPDSWQYFDKFPALSAANSTDDDISSLALLHIERAHRSFRSLCSQNNIDRESLNHDRESAVLLGPRDVHRLGSMGRVFHSRCPSNRDRFELARIEVPASRFGVVVTRQLEIVFGATELGPPGGLHVHADL